MITRINIFYEFKDSPWGGGNQFLKSLKKYLCSAGAYEPVPAKADVILFNSHQSVAEVARFKLKCPGKLFAHRIDGPMRLYNKMSDKRDDIVFVANKYLADATIFQSDWSRQQNLLSGLPKCRFETVIVNAPDPTIFNRNGKISFSMQRKVRLIATSWSKNWRKGFDVYQWLDDNLDFNKYEMVFVGKSPVRFKNIRIISPLTSKDIAEKLKESDIFIFASPIEACSNSLLEALHCGLPAVGPDRSSTPELIGRGGETFSKPDEIPLLLEKIMADYHGYQANIKNPPMEEVGKRYYDFITEVLASKQRMNSYGWIGYTRVKAEILKWRFSERISNLVGCGGEQKVTADNAAKMPLKIAVEGYPFRGPCHGGPDVFVRRLTESVISQKLAKIGCTILPFYNIALFKVTSKSLYNRPFVLRVDGVYFDTKNAIGDTEKLNAGIFSSIDKSDGVIFISEFSKKMVEKFHRKLLKPNVIIHNTVDTTIFTPDGPNLRSKLNFSEDVRVIVTSAHWRRHKRLKETVLLFNRLRRTSKCAWKLLVLGGKPDYVIEDKDIIYAGEVKPDALPSWYRTADLYVHLAWIEPCGNTQIEAMACGLPVVCTNNGGIGETVIRAKGGIVSNADEPYNFERLDYYNPPEPNYELLAGDIEKIFEDYKRWVEKIDYRTLDINNAAMLYVKFITQVYSSTKLGESTE